MNPPHRSAIVRVFLLCRCLASVRVLKPTFTCQSATTFLCEFHSSTNLRLPAQHGHAAWIHFEGGSGSKGSRHGRKNRRR